MGRRHHGDLAGVRVVVILFATRLHVDVVITFDVIMTFFRRDRFCTFFSSSALAGFMPIKIHRKTSEVQKVGLSALMLA